MGQVGPLSGPAGRRLRRRPAVPGGLGGAHRRRPPRPRPDDRPAPRPDEAVDSILTLTPLEGENDEPFVPNQRPRVREPRDQGGGPDQHSAGGAGGAAAGADGRPAGGGAGEGGLPPRGQP